MNRALRRRLDRQAKKNDGAALLAAQALSREELDVALKNWGGLLGASNYETSRSVIVTNHRDERVTIVARLEVFPAPDDATAEVVVLINPKASDEELRAMTNDLRVDGMAYRVVRTPLVPKLGGLVLRLDDLTPEQRAALEGAEEGVADAR